MSRHNLTDSEWNAIEKFLPEERPSRPGRPWRPHRQVISGIFLSCIPEFPGKIFRRNSANPKRSTIVFGDG